MIARIAEFVFWTGPAVTLFAYALFPILITLAARATRRPSVKAAASDATPVTIIIPAFNEERHIAAKIRNVLDSDYPATLLDVIVVSDGSTDRTNEIAASFADRGVRLLVQEPRRGKTAGLNLALTHARGDIVVFTDANAEYMANTITTLVNHLDDPRVGLVTGYTKYTRTATGQIADATNAYTAIEVAIKRAESVWGCCVGADGAVFAMRRSLFRPLRADDINDLVLPLTVIEQGSQCVLAESAFCSENPGESVESEFRRQSRITNRSLRAIWRRRGLLNPFRHPIFAVCLLGHKVLRFAAPLLLIASCIALAVLSVYSEFYRLVAIAAIVVLAIVAISAARPAVDGARSPWNRVVRLLHMFYSMNMAILGGWWKFLSGNTEVTWQHDRALGR